ncbi:MAG: acetyl-CoA carboxylase biotin carboxylase subunit [Tetrasphaera sp.]|nr:acetyl-CoA carboxylase biotin carboxylase subunit [Tetrasphaera sp.]
MGPTAPRPPFEKVLIANRGEIALRVIRACREMGIASVAVYSAADAGQPFVSAADEAVQIGPAAAASSYLNMPNIIGAALKTGAQAIHPGYGFLSEDPDFAMVCAEHDLVFVGPPPDVMSDVGNKAIARRLMDEAGLPLLPGTLAPLTSLDEATRVAADIGYPVILKAAAGGGGRGITVVHAPADLPGAYAATRATALAVFRDSSVYLERYLGRARHIEVQVMSDRHGGAVHLGERDCSIQRRHQKLIEEATSPAVSPSLRAELGASALAGARAVGYEGAGTVEFLLDQDGGFWFMEMNARIQVEHPVTELVTGVDLIQEQLRVAAGMPLSVAQEDIRFSGHAIECRINAEDPARGFVPTPGPITELRWPLGPGVRIDAACDLGTIVSPYYDSMIGKLIVWGPDRPAAIARTQRALGEIRIDGRGLKSTVAFHQHVLANAAFRAGDIQTDFLDRHALLAA